MSFSNAKIPGNPEDDPPFPGEIPKDRIQHFRSVLETMREKDHIGSMVTSLVAAMSAAMLPAGFIVKERNGKYYGMILVVGDRVDMNVMSAAYPDLSRRIFENHGHIPVTGDDDE